ncbi:MAG: cell division transport system ATP-binding protein, partial [Patescibacteria group bacterium]|nr:cell division transport system ATP-binding protein [Patescibacteria group bacterium]
MHCLVGVASGVRIIVPIILFETVSKEFTPESFGVRDISFTVEPGEILFITGHSGSGKTTLMKLLTREYTPSEGEIYFQDEPLSNLSKHSVHHHRRRIGVVFQDYQLVPEMNVWENIALP